MGRIDGIRVDHFIPGHEYEVGSLLAAVLLSEGWAEPVENSTTVALVMPVSGSDAEASEPNPPNLVREFYPPYYETSPALAADRRRHARPRIKPKP
jgi:hypothetical protein